MHAGNKLDPAKVPQEFLQGSVFDKLATRITWKPKPRFLSGRHLEALEGLILLTSRHRNTLIAHYDFNIHSHQLLSISSLVTRALVWSAGALCQGRAGFVGEENSYQNKMMIPYSMQVPSCGSARAAATRDHHDHDTKSARGIIVSDLRS